MKGLQKGVESEDLYELEITVGEELWRKAIKVVIIRVEGFV